MQARGRGRTSPPKVPGYDKNRYLHGLSPLLPAETRDEHLPSDPDCPPRESMQAGGRGRTSPPAWRKLPWYDKNRYLHGLSPLLAAGMRDERLPSDPDRPPCESMRAGGRGATKTVAGTASQLLPAETRYKHLPSDPDATKQRNREASNRTITGPTGRLPAPREVTLTK